MKFKISLYISVVTIALILLAGCNQQTKKPLTPADPNQLVLPVKIAGEGPFPDFLTGIWSEDGIKKRAFEFSAEGNLTMMQFWLAKAPIRHDSLLELPLKDGGKGLFKCGKWSAGYDPKTRNLEIEIIIEAFTIQRSTEKLEGAIREYYFGPVSEDGTRWDVDYAGFLEIYATTEEINQKQLHTPEEVVEETTVFYKVPVE